MYKKLITSLSMAFVISFNPYISLDKAIPFEERSSPSFLSYILTGFGFEFDQFGDGLRLLVFVLSFIFFLQAITRNKFSIEILFLVIAVLLSYALFVMSPRNFSISNLLIVLLVGVIGNCSDRKISVIFLVVGMLIKFWLTFILMLLLLALYKCSNKNNVLIQRFILVLMDSVIVFIPLYLAINHASI